MSTAKVKCSKCKAESTFKESIREEMLPFPYTNILEAVMICPSCKTRTHIFYLSPGTRLLRNQVDFAAEAHRRMKSEFSLSSFDRARKEYQEAYDSDQKKYKEFMEKEKDVAKP